MLKNKYYVFFICVALLLLIGIGEAKEDAYTKNIEIVDSGINISHQEFPPAAYLCATFKNNGDRKISNLTFEIRYYDSEDNLIQKSVIKNALNKAIKPGETGRYKIRLKGDMVDIENAQYPYEQSNKVDGFDINIVNVKFSP